MVLVFLTEEILACFFLLNANISLRVENEKFWMKKLEAILLQPLVCHSCHRSTDDCKKPQGIEWVTDVRVLVGGHRFIYITDVFKNRTIVLVESFFNLQLR